MPTTSLTIERLGDALYAALIEGRPIAPFAASNDELTLGDAYRVQRRLVMRRIAAGSEAVGWKIGLTSEKARATIGAHEPTFGYLFADGAGRNGECVDLKRFISPMVEPEIGLLLASDLIGPSVSGNDVRAATSSIALCFEIIDSRVIDWTLGLGEMIADNGCGGAFVVGDVIDIPIGDHGNPSLHVKRNGTDTAASLWSDGLASAFDATAWLANALPAHGCSLRAGDLVLTGSIGAPISVAAGDVLQFSAEGIGSCSISFRGTPYGSGASGGERAMNTETESC